MGAHPVAKNHKELIAWQLCAELRRRVLAAVKRGPAAQDYRYRNQLRAAARSACYLTSEGFYRKRDGDFLNFLVWARGSLGEVADQIDDGLECGYFTKEQHAGMNTFLKRAFGANRGLCRYLEAEIAKKKRLNKCRRRGPQAPEDPPPPGT
jgi:four helix bundle protein